MHAYVVENWRRQTFFLNIEIVVDRGTSNNITIAIVCYLIDLCGLSMVDIANKVVCFGANGFLRLEDMCYYPTHEQAQPFHCSHSLYGTSMQFGNANSFIHVFGCKD